VALPKGQSCRYQNPAAPRFYNDRSETWRVQRTNDRQRYFGAHLFAPSRSNDLSRANERFPIVLEAFLQTLIFHCHLVQQESLRSRPDPSERSYRAKAAAEEMKA